MSRVVGNVITISLAFFACIIALVLGWNHLYPDYILGCVSAKDGCMAAVNNEYGHFNGIPTSVIGLSIYFAVLVLCLKRDSILTIGLRPESFLSERTALKGNKYFSASRSLRSYDVGIWAVAGTGAALTIWSQKIAIYDLCAVCPLCLLSTFIAVAIWLMATNDLVRGSRRLTAEQRYLAGASILLTAIALMLFGPDTVLRQVRFDITPKPSATESPQRLQPNISDLVTNDVRTLGNTASPYSIVVFLDYQCPHCKRAMEMIDSTISSSPSRYRFAIRHYPLPMHRWATQAARAAEAAGEQGKFWEMSRLIFANQQEMDRSDFTQKCFREYAVDLKLDLAKFKTDMASDRIIGKVTFDASASLGFGIQEVPTFFIVNQYDEIYQITGVEKMQTALNDPSDAAWRLADAPTSQFKIPVTSKRGYIIDR